MQGFKKISVSEKKKVHKLIISPENCEFCKMFIKIITYVRKKKKSSFKKKSTARKVPISRITCENSRTSSILGKIIMFLHKKSPI